MKPQHVPDKDGPGYLHPRERVTGGSLDPRVQPE
jgi:hypothetical protein